LAQMAEDSPEISRGDAEKFRPVFAAGSLTSRSDVGLRKARFDLYGYILATFPLPEGCTEWRPTHTHTHRERERETRGNSVCARLDERPKVQTFAGARKTI